MYIAILFFVVGHIFAWYAFNSQFVWPWAKEHLWAPALICTLPMAFGFLYGTKHAVAATDELWAARLIGFGASYLAFPLMTWYYMNESMFTPKTLICVGLACMIMGIQLFWK
tara:strand:+ start:334 stop:669 length:336 start_codon:yes stop_codon:yes gene_type:complete